MQPRFLSRPCLRCLDPFSHQSLPGSRLLLQRVVPAFLGGPGLQTSSRAPGLQWGGFWGVHAMEQRERLQNTSKEAKQSHSSWALVIKLLTQESMLCSRHPAFTLKPDDLRSLDMSPPTSLSLQLPASGCAFFLCLSWCNRCPQFRLHFFLDVP